MNTRLWIAALAVWSLLWAGDCLGADEEQAQQRFDPAALRSLPNNTWLDLRLKWRGGNEIPAVFDAFA